ncbi:MAG: uroporphyrinogen decarboxylase [Candidatus Latescibacteria bacterium]|nr:uroporphyrinogen decarboxylase [Candidatus Latescibacterota bacterium]
MPGDFKGLRVVSFESRRASEIAELIGRNGGKPLTAPTMREVPLEQNTEAIAFAERLFNGGFDIVILLTGVGTRMLTKAVETTYPRERFIEALKTVTTVARGPKPVAALREMGMKPTILIPEPNTWRDLLATLDDQSPVSGEAVAVQEYGQSNPELIDGLRQRGADVMSVPVYQWALPEDLTPLRCGIEEIIAGRVDCAMFTSATQVRHLFQVASSEGVEEHLRNGFQSVCIGSIGPIASEAIVECGLHPDYEPDSPHMGDLVRDMARRSGDLLHKKRTARAHGIDTNRWRRVDMVWQDSSAIGRRSLTADSALMKACRREQTDYTPVWLMRQAGRYQREYRQLRATVPFLELCKTPDLAAEVTLMAVDRLGVDGAIIFADILLVLEPMGIGLEFSKGEGPLIRKPVRTTQDINQLREATGGELGYVFDAIAITRRALRPDLPLIGFAGAPFTVASYAVEGGGSRHYENTKMLMYRDKGAWHALMERLTHLLTGYINGQIAAGADVVQVFDSWVGCLSPDDYAEFVLPYTKRLIGGITRPTPVIHFATGNPSLLELIKQAGGDVIGLDWRVDLADARVRLGDDVAVMGNLDPVVLLASPNEIRRQVQRILDKAAGRPGHIFNLGHGILPNTPPEHVAILIDAVHELSARA